MTHMFWKLLNRWAPGCVSNELYLLENMTVREYWADKYYVLKCRMYRIEAWVLNK